jgi:hypothetical protein
MVAKFPQIYSARNFLMNAILIDYRRPQLQAPAALPQVLFA